MPAVGLEAAFDTQGGQAGVSPESVDTVDPGGSCERPGCVWSAWEGE